MRFEYKDYHFEPYLKYSTSAWNNLSNLIQTGSRIFVNQFDHADFYKLAPQFVDVFRCLENGKLYTPLSSCMLETQINTNY